MDRESANCIGLLYSIRVSDMYNLEDSPPASEASMGAYWNQAQKGCDGSHCLCLVSTTW